MNVKRISFCSPFPPTKIRNVISAAVSLSFVVPSPEKTFIRQFMPLISMRQDSEQVLLRSVWTAAPHHKTLVWMIGGATALPSTPRAGWLLGLHSKVTQLGFVPTSIRLWLTDCAPHSEQMWFLASRVTRIQTFPCVLSHKRRRRKKRYQTKRRKLLEHLVYKFWASSRNDKNGGVSLRWIYWYKIIASLLVLSKKFTDILKNIFYYPKLSKLIKKKKSHVCLKEVN